MARLNRRLKHQGIVVRTTKGKQRKNDVTAQYHATLVPYSICTPHPYGGPPAWVVHSEHSTLDEVEERLRILGLAVESGS